jgi:hypothetical protein
MLKSLAHTFIALCFLVCGLSLVAGAQHAANISVKVIKPHFVALPEQVVNVPVFVTNNAANSVSLKLNIDKPADWSLVTRAELDVLKPNEQKFLVLSVRVPSICAVGEYRLGVQIVNPETGSELAAEAATVQVQEVEKISLQLIEFDENVMAGESYKASFLLTNRGNTEKKVFLETLNCNVEGDAHIDVKPGESSTFFVGGSTSEELGTAQKRYVSVSAVVGGQVKEKVFRQITVFPLKNVKKDLYFRYPVKASVSYLAANPEDTYQSSYQFEIAGSGALDQEGKHHLEFLARGPNNADFSYLGMYDQYYLNYTNKNVDVTVGEKSYQFTPLTESSRFGKGIENKFSLNNGLAAGFVYVKPSFYKEIDHEMAFFSEYKKNDKNKLAMYFVQKKNTAEDDLVYLVSLGSSFQPFKKTNIEVEASRGFFGDIADNAFRGNIDTRFSIFSFGGSYFNVGKNYPGYYSNSTFYSGTARAQISEKVNVGVFLREDFSNAQLDTFFVSAPYSSSQQYFFNYNITPRSRMSVYWRENERRDRLNAEKFYYKTRSLNAQFRQSFSRFSSSFAGEYGETANYLLSELSNKQNTYRISSTLGYRFASTFSVRAFGSYSNLNSYITEKQRNVTAGISVNAQMWQKLRVNMYVQNAYNIEDYYRNRNLMQFDIDYKVARNHQLSFRTYYTLFRRQTENPDFFVSATYQYKLGIPLKQTLKAGDLTGRLVRDSGEPMEGVVLKFLNKSAITDKNGEFEFRSVQPGVYILDIDRSKFEFEEMPDVPQPFKVEIIEDRETTVNIGIVKGAKLKGRVVLKASNGAEFKSDEQPDIENIIIELGNDLENYRIATDKNGSFSFPLVLPRSWTLKIYANTVPDGFELETNEYQFDFKPGELVDLQVDLKQKQRKIIFKSQGITLSNSGNGGLKPLKMKTKVASQKAENKDEFYYCVQIGAFSKKIKAESSYFKSRRFDVEKQINNLYKYFVGRYSTLAEASKEQEKLRKHFKGAFVVAFKNGNQIYINDQ